MSAVVTSSACTHRVERQEDKCTLAEIFHRYFAAYLLKHKVSYYQRKVVVAIQACRTAALGGHVFLCKLCGYKRHEYDSCRNRHCPQCQIYQKLKWVSARLSELLPIPYYHGVFTMPHILNLLALYNKEIIYDLFFKATSHALNVFAQDPRFLGAKIGFIGILHTWGQKLNYHIHIHYIITGGGITNDQTRWVNLPYRNRFLFPAKAVSKRVRRKFAKLLWKAYTLDKLLFPDDLAYLKNPASFDSFLNSVSWQDWKSHMKEPFAGPQALVKYIGRYTHRVAMTNGRLTSISDAQIEFDYKKYLNNKVYPRSMSLSSDEFIRRFLLHVIPAGFKRIRHFGFLAPGSKTKAIELLNRFLATAREKIQQAQAIVDNWLTEPEERRQCPQCKVGILVVSELIAPASWAPG